MGLLYPPPACLSRGSASLMELGQCNLRIDTPQEKLGGTVVAGMEDMCGMRKEEAFEILLAPMRAQTSGLPSLVYTGFARFLEVIGGGCSLEFSCTEHSPSDLVDVVAL
jgi:hypothetical protein